MTNAAAGDCAAPPEPPSDCALCPRLVDFRQAWAAKQPDWHNAPVRSFGAGEARLLIVGLAPGARGANRTGRPFIGDSSGELLFKTMLETGLADGAYDHNGAADIDLQDAMITNAVRCLPPENRPKAAEIATCRPFLTARIRRLPRLKAILCLGRIAHESTLKALGAPLKQHPFRHAAVHALTFEQRSLTLFDSYHCSRYNTQTGVLTRDMFQDVLTTIQRRLSSTAE
ncbi:MAG: uracil-DNA glycosylase [Neomegalonema sp.]|nr:uracil-DNA glycosylase [Neomegalonema sp.]